MAGLVSILSPEVKAVFPYLAPALCEALTALGLLWDPGAFYLTDGQAAGGALLLGGLAAGRGVEWWRKWQGERALEQGASFVIAEMVRHPAGDLYLGRGFEWTGAEAQQLINLERQGRLTKLDEGGIPALHGIGAAREQDIFIPQSALGGHLFITAATGQGKTRLLDLVVAQAIERGESVILMDPKFDRDRNGGLIDRMYEACVPRGRADKFRVVSLLYPNSSMKTNPLQNFAVASEIPDRIAELLPGKSGDAENFRAYGSSFLAKLVAGQLEANERPTLESLRRYYLSEARIRELARRQPEGSRAKEGLEWLLNHPREHLQKIISILDPLFEKLTSSDLGPLLSPTKEDWHAGRVLDYQRVVEEGLICYINTGSMALGETGYTIARLWLQDFVAFMGRRYAYGQDLEKKMTVIIDEFGNIASRGAVDLINKGRGGGLRLVLAAQTFSDMRKNLSEDEALQVLGNCNVRIALRAADFDMAEHFAKLAGKTAIERVRRSVSVSPNSQHRAPLFDSNYAISTTEAADYRIQPEWITGLPVGQGFVNLGGKLWKLRIPLLPPVREKYRLPEEPETQPFFAAPEEARA